MYIKQNAFSKYSAKINLKTVSVHFDLVLDTSCMKKRCCLTTGTASSELDTSLGCNSENSVLLFDS